MKSIEKEISSLKKLCIFNGIPLESKAEGHFSVYLKLLLEWNARTNLISKNDESKIIERHFFESILLTKLLSEENVRYLLDFGSGAGFPGIPVKIMLPAVSTALVESKRIKSLFLSKVIDELNLYKTEVFNLRAETLARNPVYKKKFDLILSRAVYSLDRTLDICLPLFNEEKQSIMLFPKGPDYREELERVENEYSDRLNISMKTLDYISLENKVKKLHIVRITPKLAPD